MKTSTIATWSAAAFLATAFTPALTAEAQSQTVTQQVPLKIFKDGTTEESIMATYSEQQATVAQAVEGYTVTLAFTKGNFINTFSVNGATTTLTEQNTETNIKKYTFTVNDIPATITATVDLSVNVPELNLSYDEVYTVQMNIGDKAISFEPNDYPFTDIEHASQKAAIIKLYQQGIFASATHSNPANSVKRQQFALMLQRAYTFNDPLTTKFIDITNYSEEAQVAIRALHGIGVINGTSATTFSPNNAITRKQAALMIYRLLQQQFGYIDQVTNPQAVFSDVVGEELQAVAELNRLGIMTGFEGKFNPAQKLTRNQMAKVLQQTIQYTDNLK